jgi:drug/metabolite transporter (DMT)-like permease
VRDTLLVVGAAASWGLWSVFLRPTGLPATVTSPLLFAFMIAWTLPLALREPPVRWSRRIVLLLAGNALCDALNVITFFAAIERTTVSIAVLTHYVAPVVIALAAPRVDGVRVRHAVPIALVALVGLGLVLEPWRGATGVTGAVLGLASAVFYAGNVFVVRRLATEVGPAKTMAYHSIGALALLGAFAVPDLELVETTDLALLGLGSLTIGALAGIAFLRGLAGIGATRAGILAYCEPLVAVAVGTLVWGERLGAPAAVGALAVIGAGVAVARSTP